MVTNHNYAWILLPLKRTKKSLFEAQYICSLEYRRLIKNQDNNKSRPTKTICTQNLIKKNFCLYYNKTIFSTVNYTWINTIKSGYFRPWQGLTENLVSKNYEHIILTYKDHLNQETESASRTK